MTKYKIGSIIEGTVTGIEKYGVFVSLDEYYSGLIHISEITNGYVKNIGNFVRFGETIRVKVVDVDEDLGQVRLSIKDIDYRKVSPKNIKIEEVGSGFGILKNNLDEWILKKKEEIDRNF